MFGQRESLSKCYIMVLDERYAKVGLSYVFQNSSSDDFDASDAENSVSLYTGAESNLRDRVLVEEEKESFIALSGKGRHNGLMPSKPCVPTLGR